MEKPILTNLTESLFEPSNNVLQRPVLVGKLKLYRLGPNIALFKKMRSHHRRPFFSHHLSMKPSNNQS
jgi:hypothetical protein